MGITSAAEAKLDARIRPDITVLRSVTSYPRRHRPALAVLQGGIEGRDAGPDGDGVAAGPDGAAGAAAGPARAAGALAATGKAGASDAGAARSRVVRAAAPPGPIRLTRRGKIVVGALAVIAVAGLAALIWLAIAGRAQAAGHVRPGNPAGHAMQRVVVRPGQTLWSIATRAEPAADPRAVIQQIVDDNALRSTAIQAGQVLWVPRV